jgi:gliding motility-associated-like protein
MKYFFIFITLFISNTFFSQNETINWHFGNRSSITFNGTNATSVSSSISSNQGCASISDKYGNLELYTNGKIIWNKNHTTIENSFLTNGDLNLAQNSIFVPIKDNENRYLLFTASGSLAYSVIDTSISNGVGAVTNKENILISNGVKGITGVHHSNGNSIWIVVSAASEKGNDWTSFYSFLISNEGKISDPIISEDIQYERKGDGILKLSPNGKVLASANLVNDTERTLVLFDFDNTNGIISNQRPLRISKVFFQVIRIYGIEFSNDSNFLFATAIDEVLFSGEENTNPKSFLYQYDLNNSNFEEQFIIYEDDNLYEPGALQLSSSGYIYRAFTNINEASSPYIGEIETPTIRNDINYSINKELKNINSKLGLPNFIQSYFRTRIINDTFCSNEFNEIKIDTYTDIESVIWDFGDGNSSNEISPTHKFEISGKYKIKADITINDAIVKVEKTITVLQSPILIPNQELIECDDDTDGLSNFNLNSITSKISNNALNENFSFFLNWEDFSNNISISDIENFKNSIPNQEIIVKATNNDGCSDVVSFTLKANFIKLNDIPNFYTCSNGTDEIGNNIGEFSEKNLEAFVRNNININDEATVSFYTTLLGAQTNLDRLENEFISSSKTIYVKVQDKDLGCGGVQSFNIIVNSNPINNLNAEYTICFNPSLKPTVILIANAKNEKFEWRNSLDEVISINQNFPLTVIGDFSLTVYKNENGLMCSNRRDFTVKNPEKPKFSSIIVNTEDETNNLISITINGNSNYEFSLDSVNYFGNSKSYTFQNVEAGIRNIFIRDINNCEEDITTKVSVIGYKKYFSPNADGINDYWNIKGLNSTAFKEVNIQIFDRFGKVIGFIKDLDSFGWDGTYNGKALPNNNYWFKAMIVVDDENIITKFGNFSLLRN